MTSSTWAPRSSSAATVRVAYSAPLAPVMPMATAGVLGIQGHDQDQEIQDADVAVQIEGALHLREIVGANQRLFVDQHGRDGGNAGQIDAAERGDERQRNQAGNRDDVHRPRNGERDRNAEADRYRSQAVRAIEVEVLA